VTRKQRDSLNDVVRARLWTDWDPIGVNQQEAAAGEYDNYVSSVVGLICNRAGLQRLVNELLKFEGVDMGISLTPERRQRTQAFAQQLIVDCEPLLP